MNYKSDFAYFACPDITHSKDLHEFSQCTTDTLVLRIVGLFTCTPIPNTRHVLQIRLSIL